MRFVQVDLIVGTAKPEPDRALRLAAVNVIYVQNLRPLSHYPHSYPGYRSWPA